MPPSKMGLGLGARVHRYDGYRGLFMAPIPARNEPQTYDQDQDQHPEDQGKLKKEQQQKAIMVVCQIRSIRYTNIETVSIRFENGFC